MSRTHQHASPMQALSLPERNDATFLAFSLMPRSAARHRICLHELKRSTRKAEIGDNMQKPVNKEQLAEQLRQVRVDYEHLKRQVRDVGCRTSALYRAIERVSEPERGNGRE